jgi:hypothetical protein
MNKTAETPSRVLSEDEPRALRKDLADALAPYLMPYSDGLLEVQAQFTQYARTFAVAMEELNRKFKPFLDETLPFIQKLVETDWATVFDDHEKSFLYIADCGWTLPDWIGLSELRSLHLKSAEELDRYFVEGFMANDAENLKELGKRLKEIPRLSQWHPLIDDIIASIEAGRHRVAIPTTLTIMDGYLAGALVNASLATPTVTTPFKVLREAKWHEDDTFDAVFWNAGIIFLSRVFAKSDFTQPEPTFINRHWILHGRASVDWALSDALRLVNSLTTLDFLFVRVGQPKPNAPRWRGDHNDGFSIARNVQAPIH